MKRPHPDLPRYTRVEAEAKHLWHSAAYAALKINPARVRRWAKDGHITPKGIGPHGAVLYALADVIRHAADTTSCSVTQDAAQLDEDRTPVPETSWPRDGSNHPGPWPTF